MSKNWSAEYEGRVTFHCERNDVCDLEKIQLWRKRRKTLFHKGHCAPINENSNNPNLKIEFLKRLSIQIPRQKRVRGVEPCVEPVYVHVRTYEIGYDIDMNFKVSLEYIY